MAIYVIADLHLSLGADKPMDIFDGWQHYLSRLTENWKRVVREEDTVVIPGDVSWAMQLERCAEDFAFLESLPGRKILMKGNHDYWWTTMRKMEEYLKSKQLYSLSFLFNNSIEAEDISVCGTRSWLFETGERHDKKMMERELGRLRRSLEAAGQKEKIVFLHYPPLTTRAKACEVIEMLHEFHVKECYYGHLHGPSIGRAIQGEVEGIRYKLISADSLGFCPYKIR